MSTNDKLVTDGEKQDEPQAFEEGTESGADTCEGAIKDQVDAAQRELMDLVKRAKETKNQWIKLQVENQVPLHPLVERDSH